MTDASTVWIIARDGQRARELARVAGQKGLIRVGGLHADAMEAWLCPSGHARIQARQGERFAEFIAGRINRGVGRDQPQTVTVVAPAALAQTVRAALSDKARSRLVLRTGAVRPSGQ